MDTESADRRGRVHKGVWQRIRSCIGVVSIAAIVWIVRLGGPLPVMAAEATSSPVTIAPVTIHPAGIDLAGFDRSTGTSATGTIDRSEEASSYLVGGLRGLGRLRAFRATWGSTDYQAPFGPLYANDRMYVSRISAFASGGADQKAMYAEIWYNETAFGAAAVGPTGQFRLALLADGVSKYDNGWPLSSASGSWPYQAASMIIRKGDVDKDLTTTRIAAGTKPNAGRRGYTNAGFVWVVAAKNGGGSWDVTATVGVTSYASSQQESFKRVAWTQAAEPEFEVRDTGSRTASGLAVYRWASDFGVMKTFIPQTPPPIGWSVDQEAIAMAGWTTDPLAIAAIDAGVSDLEGSEGAWIYAGSPGADEDLSPDGKQPPSEIGGVGGIPGIGGWPTTLDGWIEKLGPLKEYAQSLLWPLTVWGSLVTSDGAS